TVTELPPPVTTLGGQKFDDRNGNGVRDPGEPALNGWTIELVDPATGAVVATQVTRDIDLNIDGVIDPETERGRYAFAGVAPGSYQVREVLQDGWAQTFPAGLTERASVDSAGDQGNHHSFRPSLSGDGRFVAFESDAADLVAGDTNGM